MNLPLSEEPATNIVWAHKLLRGKRSTLLLGAALMQYCDLSIPSGLRLPSPKLAFRLSNGSPMFEGEGLSFLTHMLTSGVWYLRLAGLGRDNDQSRLPGAHDLT